MAKAVLFALGCLMASALGLFPQRVNFAPAPGSPFATGNQPSDIAVGDVNRDGKLDLVTANSGSNNFTVLLGDGRGGFRPVPGSPFDAGPKPHLIVLADFNNDRSLDVAVTEHDSNEVRVFLGHGDGRFAVAPGSPFRALASPRPHNHGLSASDVNHDGNADLTTSNQNDASVSVLLGDGRGGFAPAAGSPFTVGRDPYNHALGDVNGDGNLDLVAPNVRGDSVSVLLGDGRGSFKAAPNTPFAVPHRPYYTALGDFNGDGRLDIGVSHDDVTLVTVWLGDGRGGFLTAPGSPFDARHRGWKLAVGDVNADRKLDLLTGAVGNVVVVLLNDGAGRFAPAPVSSIPTGEGPWGIAVADFNADGKLDFATANSEGNNVSVFLAK